MAGIEAGLICFAVSSGVLVDDRLGHSRGATVMMAPGISGNVLTASDTVV